MSQQSTDYLNNINNKHRKIGRNTYLSLDLKQTPSTLRKNIGIFGYRGFRISGYRGSREFEEREFCF